MARQYAKQRLYIYDLLFINTTHSARNLRFIFDKYLTFSDQISSLSKSCYSHIWELRCIRPYLDSKTASAIAASIVHFKLDYCNSVCSAADSGKLDRFLNRCRKLYRCQQL